eukprot:3001677-Lingulodinium_polyedra.AAC.1
MAGASTSTTPCSQGPPGACTSQAREEAPGTGRLKGAKRPREASSRRLWRRVGARPSAWWWSRTAATPGT